MVRGRGTDSDSPESGSSQPKKREPSLQQDSGDPWSLPDYGADPTRYGGEKLARIVASDATKAYEEFELLWQALSREFAFRPTLPSENHFPRHPLYSEEPLPKGAGGI